MKKKIVCLALLFAIAWLEEDKAFSQVINRLDSTGSIGIGTLSPLLGQLHIAGNANAGTAPNRPRIGLEDVAGSGQWLIQPWSTAGDGNLSILRNAGSGNLLLLNSGGNLGLGAYTPRPADALAKTFQMGDRFIFQNVIGTQALVSNNAYYDGTGWKYATSAPASAIRLNGLNTAGEITFSIAGSGTGGSAISSWDDACVKMVILPAGNVGIGTSAPISSHKLDVRGVIGTVNSSNNAYTMRMNAESSVPKLQADNFTGAAYSDMAFETGNGSGSYIERMRIAGNNGYLGIGVTNPIDKMEVAGGIHTSGTAAASKAAEAWVDYYSGTGRLGIMGPNGSTQGKFSITSYKGDGSAAIDLLVSDVSGNIGVGTSNPTEKFSVNGNVRAKKIIVTLNGWSDYVFHDNYRLRSLSSLESFIKQNKHLPDVPSAKEVEEKGISVGDNQALLLKKIEELTLYVIELKKESIAQKKEIKKIKQLLAVKK